MTVTSANLDDLQTFIDGSSNRRGRLEASRSSADTKASAVFNACSFQRPDTPSLAALDELLGAWRENERFVRTVRRELVEADRYDADGNPIVASAAIDAALRSAGLDGAPDLVEVDAIQLYGTPPYSGWVDDPINMANGNFLLRDGDLSIPGTAAALSVVRVHNSRDPHHGAFGARWSSVLDVSLAVDDHRATFRGPDGGGTVFARRGDGRWTRDHRRQLALHGDDAGWEVREGHERSWRFDADGTCTGFRAGAADATIERSAEEVRVTDRTTGRWVAYGFDGTRVVEARSSDGRTATYDWDDEARLVGVRRPCGDVTYGYDDHGFLAEVVDADGIVVCRNTYDPAGRVLTQVEQHGRETRYEYRPDGVATVTASDGAAPNVLVHDRRGRMTAMIDGLGHTMRVTYGDADEITQIVDRTGAVTRFTHDERGNVLVRTDPDGRTQTYAWDDHDRLVADTDRSGATTRYHYEGDSRDATRIVLADGSEVRLTYAAPGLPASITDADGVSAALSWTRDGLLASVVDGVGAEYRIEYDAAGRTVRMATPSGRHATVDLDRAGRPRALRTPDGERIFEHTAAGRIVGGRDERGTAWRAELDAAGDVARLADTQGQLLAYERDTVGRVVATVAADGARARYDLDPLGRRTATVDPEGGRTEVVHDAEGREVRVTDASGRSWARELDSLGRPTTIVGPDGAARHCTYHPGGQLATVTDPAGNRWAYDVDVLGRVVRATDPAGGTTTYRYTPGGRLSEIVSPLGRTVRREYDRAGRLARIVEPDGTEVVYERRADGSPSRITRAGVPLSFDYDDLGRTSAIVGPWGSLEATHADGTVDAVVVAGATSRFEHDARGLLRRVTDPAGVVTELVHDESGRLLAHSTADSTTGYRWDAAGRLAGVVDAYGNETALERDPRGAIAGIVRPDGSATRLRYGADGRLAAVLGDTGEELVTVRRDELGAIVGVEAAGSAPLGLAHDVLGRTTEVTTGAGTVRYRWDADSCFAGLADGSGFELVVDRDAVGTVTGFQVAGRRIDAPAPVGLERDERRRIVRDEQGRTYGYDVAGRLAWATVAGATTTYGYDDLGLLASEHGGAGTRRYRYGLAGELTTLEREDGTQDVFDHDAEGRRVREVRGDGAEVTYGWDAFGRLTSVTVTGTGATTEHRIEHDPTGRPARIDGTPVLWDRAATGALLGIGDERYVRAGDQVLVATDSDASWSRQVTDDPWGDDGGSGLRIGYRGELALDHLLFLGRRVYDTNTRSFLTRDPLPPVPGALAFAGPYAYAWNDPVNFVDPTGERPLSDEDYEAWKEANTKGWLRDPKNLAKVGIIVASVAAMVVATALLGPVGTVVAAGVIGAISNGSMTALDGGDAGDITRSAVLGGLFGAATAGLGTKLPGGFTSTLGRRIATTAGTEYPSAIAQEGLDSLRMLGGDGRMDWDKALINGTISTSGGVIGGELSRPLDFDDLSLRGALDGETPASLLPDPASRTVLDINAASAADLQRVHGIGETLSQRIVAARDASGGFTSTQDLLDIDGIGPSRLEAIIGAGGVAQ